MKSFFSQILQHEIDQLRSLETGPVDIWLPQFHQQGQIVHVTQDFNKCFPVHWLLALFSQPFLEDLCVNSFSIIQVFVGHDLHSRNWESSGTPRGTVSHNSQLLTVIIYKHFTKAWLVELAEPGYLQIYLWCTLSE